MTDHILASIADGIGTMTLNRPDTLNALTPEMVEGLIDISGQFERDSAVRCVVIRAAGETFMAGGNVKEFHQSVLDDQPAYAVNLERGIVNGHMSIHRLRRMGKPVLVSAQGAAAGFGMSLICAADLAIAAEEASFLLAYRHIGLTADGGVSYFLPRIIGERRALEMSLLGDRVSAQKALEWGLLNWVVTRAALADQTAKIARRLADGPPFALGSAKKLFRGSWQNSWEEQSARESESISTAAALADHREGLAAFLEKRKPVFGQD